MPKVDLLCVLINDNETRDAREIFRSIVTHFNASSYFLIFHEGLALEIDDEDDVKQITDFFFSWKICLDFWRLVKTLSEQEIKK